MRIDDPLAQEEAQLAISKATHSRGRKKTTSSTRIVRFPEAKGKTIAEVELSVSSTEYAIDIRFQDKTSLTFDVEPCVQVFSELTDWKSGIYKPVKRWRSVHGRSSRE